MNITFKSEHRNSGKRNPARKGKKDFVYAVSGTPQELADFKKSQDKFYFEDENGTALLSSSRDLGANAQLVKRRTDGRWVPVVDEKVVAIGKLAKLAGQFPMFTAQFGAEASAIAVRDENTSSAPVATPVASAETAKL